ncbi:MCE family protein [Rhodococcoides kyotonense]|uniref:Mammalian cell entry protein n=1 Tax=Rhodococcoides kyotonense TaxID=398843 RepID=A0A177YLT4_9NOCA|nr:MCE family protein [Rhodococcus kyotonensis]OAK56220.1 mammalian cell entry protein [Rhodococcus kyotonensis]
MITGLDTRSRASNVVLGLLGVVIMVAAAALSVVVYRGALDSTIRVTLISTRVGLMLEPGSDVKLRDVVVGRVDDVRFTDGQATIDMVIDSDQAADIPGNVAAVIDPTTLFGRKFVTLSAPTSAPTGTLTNGSVIDTQSVPTEVNDLLASLVEVLRAVEPQKVNGSLNALATALHGRGEKLGETLVQLDGYVRQFNNSLPTLQRDLATGAQTANILADASPDLMRMVNNLTTSGNTITEKESELSSFLLSFTQFGNSGETFMNAAGTPLKASLNSLSPTTALLAERASTLPCFVSSLAQTNRYLERTVGGSAMPGLNIRGTLLMGDPPYASPDDLPVVQADGPASCYDWSQPVPHSDFDDGSHAYSKAETLLDLIGNPFAQFLPGGGQ